LRVLLAEDDTSLAAALQHILREAGWDIDVVHDGQSALDYAMLADYDVIVLDIMLPKVEGREVTRRLRAARNNTPILLLSALSQITDKISGLDSGADDYMTKPFAPAELLAHLRALTRRKGDVVMNEIICGDLTLNLSQSTLASAGRSVTLSAKELDLAKILMQAPGIVFSKAQLQEKAWSTETTTTENNVEAYISFLRKKLEHIGSHTEIETLRRLGYKLVPSESAIAGINSSTSRTGDRKNNAAVSKKGGNMPNRSAETSRLHDNKGRWRM
jgi:DNA-binding response OmpR family regulator